MKVFVALCVLCIPACVCLAQAPVGTIAGAVHDPSGAVIEGAQVQVINRATGLVRAALTTGQGDYSFPALPAGEYEVSAQSPGLQRVVREATVEVGTTTTTDFALRVGGVSESVIVDAASPLLHYDSSAIGGIVTQSQINGLPLNGRSFLELAKLEPGVQAPAPAN